MHVCMYVCTYTVSLPSMTTLCQPLHLMIEYRGGSEPYSDDRGGGRGRGRGNNTRWREGKTLCVILLIFHCCGICCFHLLNLRR